MSTVDEAVTVRVVPDNRFWVLVLLSFVLGAGTGVVCSVYGQQKFLDNVRIYSEIARDQCVYDGGPKPAPRPRGVPVGSAVEE